MDSKKMIIILSILNYIIFCFGLSKIFNLSAYDSIGYAITLTLLEILVFRKWIWKLNCIIKITGIDNLQGEWSGILHSNYDDKDHTVEKIIIKQSFNKYKLVMETKESKSQSDICEIKINEFGRMELQYLYKNESPVTLRKKNPMHFGVADLEYKDKKLIGVYWTDREIDNGKNTRGTMELTKVNSKGNYDLISLFDLFSLF